LTIKRRGKKLTANERREEFLKNLWLNVREAAGTAGGRTSQYTLSARGATHASLGGSRCLALISGYGGGKRT